MSNKIKFLFLLLGISAVFLYCDTRGTTDDEVLEDRAERERQLDKEKNPIRTLTSADYNCKYNPNDYDGDKCSDLRRDDQERYSECTNQCKEMYRSDIKLCRSLPVDLIDDLYDLFTGLRRIEDSEQDINAQDFCVMIDRSVHPILTVIGRWSKREVGDFLTIVAKSSFMSGALEQHDKDNEILEKAFAKLGGSASKGVTLNLAGVDSTFLAIAEEQKPSNDQAFVIFHNVLSDICRKNKDCIKKSYCIREEYENTRNRNTCHYQKNTRGFNRSNHCYIYGPDVWSHLEDLSQSRDFTFTGFSKGSLIFSEKECDTICAKAGTNCKKSS